MGKLIENGNKQQGDFSVTKCGLVHYMAHQSELFFLLVFFIAKMTPNGGWLDGATEGVSCCGRTSLLF